MPKKRRDNTEDRERFTKGGAENAQMSLFASRWGANERKRIRELRGRLGVRLRCKFREKKKMRRVTARGTGKGVNPSDENSIPHPPWRGIGAQGESEDLFALEEVTFERLQGGCSCGGGGVFGKD